VLGSARYFTCKYLHARLASTYTHDLQVLAQLFTSTYRKTHAEAWETHAEVWENANLGLGKRKPRFENYLPRFENVEENRRPTTYVEY
jgi:hypothetical protein